MFFWKLPALIVAGMLALSACASAPITTLTAKTQLDELNFRGIRAEDMRLRVDVPAGVTLKLDKPAMKAEIYTVRSVRNIPLQFEPVAVAPREIEEGLFTTTREAREQLELRLTSASMAALKKAQAAIKDEQQTKLKFDIAVEFDKLPTRGQPFQTSLELLLVPVDGYISVVDEYQIDAGQVAETEL